ncbi:Kelch repeat-containing protein [Pseudonocardia sp. TRM90224]|uniref:Kelch repeat-containing protein n=1 Tax=Pseudonocardia sp. TRM90224 TaxID=2812678 RepID=UPI0027E11901|nr:kelch repeat-containing protein [Pseudonocardia sp. TRM90224]
MNTEQGPAPTAGGRPAVVVDLARAGFVDAVEVGRGGFGVVFRCHQEALNRTVAVKLLHTDLDTVSRERFFREGRAMGGLSGHPNVVDVLQVGVTDSGRPYIVMPFQSLDSLAARVRRDGPIGWTEAVRLGVRLAGALESAHRVGTLHRDVKPANILLSDYGEAQLTDFGIARIEGGFETATGAFTGSLSYTAPEVLNGHPPTPASDIYGLGAALFSIIAGRAAFERREGEEIIAQFLRITGQPIPDLRGHGVPDELCAVLEQAMAKNPAERPASAEALGHELQEVQRAAGLPVAEMALPVKARPTTTDDDLTEAAGPDDRSPRRVSGPLPLVDRPWTPVAPLPRPDRSSTSNPSVETGNFGRPGNTGGSGNTGNTGGSGAEVATTALPRQPSPSPRPAAPTTQAPTQAPTEALPPVAPPPTTGNGSAPQPSPDRRRRLPVMAAIITAVALLASLTVAGVFVLRGRSTVDTPPLVDPGPPAVTEMVPPSAWRPLRDSPTPRQQVATTVADGTLWVLGGLTDDGASTVVEGFDPAINTWKTSPIPLPVALHHAMAATYRGEILVLGGWQPVGADLIGISSNKVYSQTGGSWLERPAMLSPRVAGGAVVIGDRIIVTGGQANGQLVPTTEIYDGEKWTRGPDIPTPREHLALVTDGTYAYAIGGRNLNANSNSDAVERYDPVANKWEKLASLPTPRGGIGAAVADGRIVVVGGETPTTVMNDVDAFDIASGTWSPMPKLPTPRHGAAVGAVGKTIYALDGAVKPSHKASVPTVEAFDVPPRRLQPAPAWRAVKDAPVARQFTGSAVVDGTMWVVGGLKAGDATAEVYAYVPGIGNWQQGPDLPIPLHHTAAVNYKGELWVLGGWTPKNGNSSGEVTPKVFALRDGKWVEQPPLLRPRVAGAAAVVGDKIVVVGGQDGNQGLIPVTEVFDGKTWVDAAPVPTPREHLAAATDDKYVYAVGGRDLSSSKNTGAFERFDPTTGAWEKLPAMPMARGGAGAAFFDGRIIVAGGEEPTRVLDTVESFDLDTGAWRTLAPLKVARHGMAVATVGNSVLAVNGAQRPTHQQSASVVEALDFG